MEPTDDSKFDHFKFEKILSLRKKESLSPLHLYFITDRSRFQDSSHGDTAFLDHIAACLESGIRMVQLRESRHIPTRRIISLAKALRSITSEFETLFLVHERVDIAKAVEADGVHIGPDDLDVFSARKILGQEFIIGLSVHTQSEAEIAFQQDVDYLTAGPVFASEMLPGQPAVGLKLMQWMRDNTPLPWFAAGGIDFSNLPQLQEQGVERVALTRCLMASKTPKEDTKRLLEAMALHRSDYSLRV